MSGAEGRSSCFKSFYSFASSWADGKTLCELASPGAHLITFNTSAKLAGLFGVIISSIWTVAPNAWVGCYQDWDATHRGQAWHWVDDTSPENLNCAMGGGDGCGLWGAGMPDDFGCGGVEGGCQNYCKFRGGLLDDSSSPVTTIPYANILCEVDVNFPSGKLVWAGYMDAGLDCSVASLNAVPWCVLCSDIHPLSIPYTRRKPIIVINTDPLALSHANKPVPTT